MDRAKIEGGSDQFAQLLERAAKRERRSNKVRGWTAGAFMAALAPILVAGPLSRVADDVAHVARGGSLAQSDFDIPHPRVMRSGIVAMAVMAKHSRDENALGILTGYGDFVKARFLDSRLGTCLSDEVAERHTGDAVGGAVENAECLAPIVGTDVATLRDESRY